MSGRATHVVSYDPEEHDVRDGHGGGGMEGEGRGGDGADLSQEVGRGGRYDGGK